MTGAHGVPRDAAGEYTAWLSRFLPARYRRDDHSYRDDWELRREYQRALFESGWLQPHWEVGLGGQGLTPSESLAVRLAEAAAGAPKLYAIGSVYVAAPAVRAYGTAAQRERFLVPALRGDERWCLGMSEPDAGSDLASLRTRAEIDGDDVVVNGRKIWTSQAHWADWCLLYCRTDPDVPKHRGLSCLALDMDLHGVRASPITMADGASEQFCEVELVDVRTTTDRFIGSRGDGWRIATGALADERDALWLMNYAELLRLHRLAGTVSEGWLTERWGRSVADALAVRRIGEDARRKESRGVPNPEFLALKLLCSEALEQAFDLLVDMGQIVDRDVLVADELGVLAATIYGGTSEIQRDIIGERVLGLPRAR